MIVVTEGASVSPMLTLISRGSGCVLLVDALSHHMDFMAPLRSSKIPVGLRAGMGHGDDNNPTSHDSRSAVECIAADFRTSGDTSKGWLRFA